MYLQPARQRLFVIVVIIIFIDIGKRGRTLYFQKRFPPVKRAVDLVAVPVIDGVGKGTVCRHVLRAAVHDEGRHRVLGL